MNRKKKELWSRGPTLNLEGPSQGHEYTVRDALEEFIALDGSPCYAPRGNHLLGGQSCLQHRRWFGYVARRGVLHC